MDSSYFYVAYSNVNRKKKLAKSFSRVQFFATLWTVGHQDPLSMTFLQARILEWVAMPFSRGFSRPRDRTKKKKCLGPKLGGSAPAVYEQVCTGQAP